MEPDPNDSLERYPLRSLVTTLRTYKPPSGPFDPAGSWDQAWGVCTLAGQTVGARPVGSLTLRRRVSGKDATLEVAYDKMLSGGRQKIAATLRGRADDPLATPDGWTFQIDLLDTAGKPVPHTQVRKRAAVEKGTITIRDAAETRRIAVAGPYTVNWCLFDAVQRLPREKTKPLAFTLIDHFDQPKPETTLAYRKPMTVGVAGGLTVATHAYEQFGRGNVPWVYWVDEAGRLLFVVAGLEGYVLRESKQA